MTTTDQVKVAICAARMVAVPIGWECLAVFHMQEHDFTSDFFEERDRAEGGLAAPLGEVASSKPWSRLCIDWLRAVSTRLRSPAHSCISSDTCFANGSVPATVLLPPLTSTSNTLSASR
mmetsp:Transcript_770/g.766  ORF Transcript_770/g.766 Transcript_770/m.766 type:complete len:119 (-) Transcript_770:548-904(-)